MNRSLLPLAVAAAVVVVVVSPALAQPAAGFAPPVTSWGAPDLQGFWNNTSLTSMERQPIATKLAVSEDEAEQLARMNVYSRAASSDSTTSSLSWESSQRLLADKNTSRAYNSFWLDPGSAYAKVKGEYRTSWVVDPLDGLIPYTDKARAALTRIQAFDGPEVRPQSERCLMSFTGGAGPVMNNGSYNNNYQIVQTPDAVMILTEMIHDVRIIPIGGAHGAANISKWGGDSVGRYEGATLIVETVNPNPKQRSYITSAGKLTERFTRWSEDQILYKFTVEDPTIYTAAWRGEMTLRSSKQPVYEYACHEGNYALPSILAGARLFERQGRPEQPIRQPFNGIDVSEGQ